MFYALFSLFIAFTVADRTGPPKARRSAAVCDYYACPLEDEANSPLNGVAIASLSPPEVACSYAGGGAEQCGYNYITGQVFLGQLCLPASCVPQQACTDYECPAIPGYILVSDPEGPNGPDGDDGVSCSYRPTDPTDSDIICLYFTSNGQLLGATGTAALICPARGSCTSAPARRWAYQQSERRTINEEERDSKADEFEDLYQPW
ncbi:hypothetical protein CALVIDRAFT_600004 [Calocera viscosa TUFC12733]|uniref:Uncharacterized protein n=1 Tax=Calocera viscosa (strain TUFC12733) TaxID=1330018 RepID=A0A167K7A6_CALVF|nr:hypothetical protein CALVIDRAFT_600004 [Calocera viscosa TUFC12733]